MQWLEAERREVAVNVAVSHSHGQCYVGAAASRSQDDHSSLQDRAAYDWGVHASEVGCHRGMGPMIVTLGARARGLGHYSEQPAKVDNDRGCTQYRRARKQNQTARFSDALYRASLQYLQHLQPDTQPQVSCRIGNRARVRSVLELALLLKPTMI